MKKLVVVIGLILILASHSMASIVFPQTAPRGKKIVNLTLTNASTVYPATLFGWVSAYGISGRGGGIVRWHDTSNVASAYISIPEGSCEWNHQRIYIGADTTWYFSSTTSGEVVEIVYWYY